MQFPLITYGMELYETTVYRQTLTLIKMYMYVYASERSERAWQILEFLHS